MEVPFIPKAFLQKTDSPGQVRPTQPKQAADAYASQAARDREDKVQISSESRLLQKLQSDYKKLENAENSMFKAKFDVDKLSLGMSAEDIVEGILKGTLFEVV